MAAFLVMMLTANFRIYQKKQELNYQIKTLQQKVTDIKKQNDNLTQEIANAQNQAYIEKVAREELDLQKPGEKVFSFVQTQPQVEPAPPSPKSIWQQFTAWIGEWIK